jgi:DNA-binding FrmR family transcriptional regulator
MKSLGLVLVTRPAKGRRVEVRRTVQQRGLAFGAEVRYTPVGMRSSTLQTSELEKSKLVKRLSRIRGQVDALRRAIVEQDASSAKLLQQATACRGAMDGFIAEIIEDHIREQVVKAENKSQASRAAEELIGIVHSYLT